MNTLDRLYYIATIVAMFTNMPEKINFNAVIVVLLTNTLERTLINAAAPKMRNYQTWLLLVNLTLEIS